MRITGGQAKGRLLFSPRGLRIRPTTDQVRESIFSIIGQDLSGLKVLDLFAGTGALGLEALSRGADCALFIDNSPQSMRLIKRNLELCGYYERGIVFKRDLKRGIPWSHPFFDQEIDLVFMDPPYGKDFLPPLLEELSTGKGLSSRAQIVTESFKKFDPPALGGALGLQDSRSYGDTRISIYGYGVKQ